MSIPSYLRTKVIAKIPHVGLRPPFVTVPPSYDRESTREPNAKTTNEEPKVEGRRPRLRWRSGAEGEGNNGKDDDGRM